MDSIYSLLQEPISFETNGVRGKLFVKGNTEKNRIQFFVFFQNKELIIPLLITVKDNQGKSFRVFLMIRDEEKKYIASHLYEPDYLIRKGLLITKIQPLICLEKKDGNINTYSR